MMKMTKNISTSENQNFSEIEKNNLADYYTNVSGILFAVTLQTLVMHHNIILHH